MGLRPRARFARAWSSANKTTRYEYPINLEFNESTFRVTITMAENYQLDFTKTNFYEVIEFDKKNHERQKQ